MILESKEPKPSTDNDNNREKMESFPDQLTKSSGCFILKKREKKRGKMVSSIRL